MSSKINFNSSYLAPSSGDMYRKTSPSSPLQKGSQWSSTYDRYGIPYGQPIEWATPRLASHHKTRTVSDGGHGAIPTRNLFQDKSISEPSSPHLKQNSVSRSQADVQVYPHSKLTQQASTSSSFEDVNPKKASPKSSRGTDPPFSNQNIHLPGTSPLRKWSSYSGLTNDVVEGKRPDEGGKSYPGSVEHIDRMYGAVPANYQYGSHAAQLLPQGNVLYEQSTLGYGTNASVAYVAPLRQDSSTLDGYATPKSSSRSRTPSSTHSAEDGDKWDSLLRAKDDLICQKDQIIERQKKTIVQLQHNQLSMDAKLQHALLIKSCDQDSVVTLKLQEYHYEMAQLRAQLSQMAAEKDAEIDKLQRKLGETEYLLDKMDACVKDTAALKNKDVESLQNQLLAKEKLISELQSKIETLKHEHLNVKRRMESLERYLSDVPTTEEYQNTIKTLKEVREECSQLKDIITNKDRKLSQINKAYGTKSEEAKRFHKENKALKEKVSSLETNLDKYKKNGPVSEIEFDDLKMENERLEAELNQMKKILEAKHKKMKALHAQTQKTQKGLEERLAQEEDTVVALRDEITSKDQTLQKLRKSLKELSSQNQDMMEQNLNLKTSCEQFQKAKMEESEKIEMSGKLWKEVQQFQEYNVKCKRFKVGLHTVESCVTTYSGLQLYMVEYLVYKLEYTMYNVTMLSKCVSDLKAIVQLCMARKKGEDPNMSLLLGLRGPSLGGDDVEELRDDLCGLKSKIRKIQEIQQEIDALRTFVSDQYAEDVGNNCITQ